MDLHLGLNSGVSPSLVGSVSIPVWDEPQSYAQIRLVSRAYKFVSDLAMEYRGM
jgi:hypothetical protein